MWDGGGARESHLAPASERQSPIHRVPETAASKLRQPANHLPPIPIPSRYGPGGSRFCSRCFSPIGTGPRPGAPTPRSSLPSSSKGPSPPPQRSAPPQQQ